MTAGRGYYNIADARGGRTFLDHYHEKDSIVVRISPLCTLSAFPGMFHGQNGDKILG
jgi:hypothetical protein